MRSSPSDGGDTPPPLWQGDAGLVAAVSRGRWLGRASQLSERSRGVDVHRRNRPGDPTIPDDRFPSLPPRSPFPLFPLILLFLPVPPSRSSRRCRPFFRPARRAPHHRAAPKRRGIRRPVDDRPDPVPGDALAHQAVWRRPVADAVVGRVRASRCCSSIGLTTSPPGLYLLPRTHAAARPVARSLRPRVPLETGRRRSSPLVCPGVAAIAVGSPAA